MLVKEITVTIKVDAETPVRLKDKMLLLTAISYLDAPDQQRIIEICKNPKALNAIAENWEMLQPMFK